MPGALDYDAVDTLLSGIPMTDSISRKAPKDSAPLRKTYRSPVLSQYGDVKRLTRGNGNGAGDMAGGAGPMTKACWIAETLYGVDAPRVLLVRAWLSRCLERRDGWALAVVPLYSRFGQRVAAALKIVPAMKPIFRPLFDRAVSHAFQEYAVQAVARRNFP
jgi:hypothetical protein